MSKVDVITTEIIRNRLVAATEEMAKTLVRTAFNPVLYETQDYAASILSPSGDLWAETPGVIVFSQGFPDAIRAGLRHWGNKFEDGDILVVNDPFVTGTHISDTNVYMPVFFDGTLVAFAGIAAHWADIGGKNPGGWSPDSTEMYQEGLCFTHQRLFIGGKKNIDLWDLIAKNVRVPTIVIGDLEAQIAACRQGADRIRAICAKYGPDSLAGSMTLVVEQTDKAMRKEISLLPRGEYGASIRLDSDGVSENGEFLLCLSVTIEDNKIRMSLEGSSPQAKGPINLPATGTFGILASSLKGILMPFDHFNVGHTKCLEVEIPHGLIVSPAPPAPTDSYGYLVVCLMELMFRCFARIKPERCPAGGYQCTAAFFSRASSTEQTPFVMIDNFHGGNGAQQSRDGQTNQLVGNGDLPNTPIEILESRFPFRVEKMEYAPDVSGAGKWRGGMGISKDYRLLSGGIDVSLIIENTNDPTSRGVDGGADGRHGCIVINPEQPNEQRITKRTGGLGPYAAGTVIRVVTGGGGGWGSPLDRDPEQVLADVRNGFVSDAEAKGIYGVAIDRRDDGDVVLSVAGTERLRSKRRHSSTLTKL